MEMDCGGADMLSTAERSIIRHAALAGAMIEDLGARWLAGEAIDPALFSTLSNTERRLYETIGLRRRPRDVGRRWALCCEPIWISNASASGWK